MVPASKEHLPLLLEHPLEPVFLPKGKNHIVFDVPDDYILSDYVRYKSRPRYYTEVIHVEVKDTLPKKFKEAVDKKNTLGREENFSIFAHHKIADGLIDLLYKLKTIDQLIPGAIYIRERANASLFHYVLYVVLLHRADTQDLQLPSLIKSFPGQFLQPSVLAKAVVTMSLVPEEKRPPVKIPIEWTAKKWDPEHRLFYFREDFGVNLHHWHWHSVYPFSGDMVKKDRRGELFYYMHQQLVARYDFERLCNRLQRVEPLSDFREPIKEGYFSKLINQVSSKNYGVRAANRKLRNIERDDSNIDLSDMERWRERIIDAIAKGQLIDENKKAVPLGEEGDIDVGIDRLGNVIEASTLSVNKGYYGSLHNSGHMIISAEHDPDNRYRESLNVMSEETVAPRDPVFYRWHKFINNIFVSYKETLQPYGADKLGYKNITISDVNVKSSDGLRNEINTFWKKSQVELSSGMDFIEGTGPLVVEFTHLQHEPFTYNITVDNASPTTKYGTCRIFLAPEFNERGLRWFLQDQRHVIIELDKFKVELKPKKNKITRLSSESSVTIPFEQIFSVTDPKQKESYCGCGWPEYLLLPKGMPRDMHGSGAMLCNLFVMISNYDDDKVLEEKDSENNSCHEAFSFCGIKDRKYPDRRAMGFPFDRPFEKNITLDAFADRYDNMMAVAFTVAGSEFPTDNSDNSNKST